jgi:radical SAM superfamily enzyme YgiQ (UPF0313 family)
VPRPVWEFLKGKPPKNEKGRAFVSPYSIRKIEAALLERYNEQQVVVAHEDYIESFIKEDTEIIGVYTMDPLGLGPLTMSYAMLFGDTSKPWVRVEFENLLKRINRARRGKKAKVVVGGPGVWEFTILPEVLDELNIDYAFQGEADDIVCELFEDLSGNSLGKKYFEGFQSFDERFRKVWVGHEKFITRNFSGKQYPSLEDIPLIKNPAIKSLNEVMRGCGVGCDFCEVTLRPLRYYTIDMITKEIQVNMTAGYRNAWLHSDEIFAYMHGPHFTPNEDALIELFGSVMKIKGIESTNPTHGRISIPAAYPELMKKLSSIMRAGPDRWIGVQVGLETGSDRLALRHMPNKTLPLRIGPDGSWKEIVTEGLRNMNKYYWRPAFTVQVGQIEETEEDNWETVALINRLSNMEVDGRPAEFTVTPMQNMPLGRIKSRDYSPEILTQAQLAVYYASYRHLMKMAQRDAIKDSKGNIVKRTAIASILNVGAWALLYVIEKICKKKGLDLEKVKRYGLEGEKLYVYAS